MNSQKWQNLFKEHSRRLLWVVGVWLLWTMMLGRTAPILTPDLDQTIDRKVIQFEHYDFTITTQRQQGHLDVRAVAEVKVVSDRVHQIQFLLTNLYQIRIWSITVNGRELEYRYIGDVVQVDLPFSCFRGKRLTLTVDYRMERVTVSADVLAELRGNWYPKNILPEPARAVFKLDVPEGYIGIANGHPLKVIREEERRIFYWEMENPATSFGVSIGTYQQRTESVQGRPFHLYYLSSIGPEMIQKTVRWSEKIFGIYQDEFGGILPDNFTVVINDTPLGESAFGSLIYLHYRSSGQETTDETLFEALAHEIAHYWWGNLIVPKNVYDWWIVEGFATYSAAVAGWRMAPVENISLNQIRDRQKWRERYAETVTKLKQYCFPELALAEISPFDIQRELFYSKGPFVLAMLREQLGEAEMQRYLKKFVNRYAGRTAGVRDFTRLGAELYGTGILNFFRQWIYSTGAYNVKLDRVTIRPTAGGYQVTVVVKRNGQLSLPDRVRIEIITDGRVYSELLQFKGVSVTIQRTLPVKPLKIMVNPRDEILEMDDQDNLWN
ncbi:MAG TPA: M1 family aminopeptidase [Bacillota bacterium]|nr:M1 family aminopeptidase [Bacillota bacterium]